MSQEKAQLIAPQGHFTVPGLNVAGVVTASSFSGNCTGTASSLTQGSNVVVGVMTASSFAGDVFGNAAGLSTTTAGLKLGIVTSTSFAGNFTGIGSGLTGTPNIVAGLVTASQFVGNTPGLAAGLSAGKNLAAGIVTATTFHGDGSGLTGAGSTAFIRQDVTAQSGTTTINLNDGNIIYLTHSNNTTIAFSNVKTADDVTIIRTLTDNTITWPAAIKWNGGSAPTLIGASSGSSSGQVFNLVTADGGTTWYGYEEVNRPDKNELWMWGYNNAGTLGQNERTNRSSPTQVSGTTWSSIVIGANQDTYATKTDGTLWAWGNSNGGALGQNNVVQYSSPVQIPGTTWSQALLNTQNNAAAIKTDGTLWAWGYNQFGTLGQNISMSPGARSSPVQIPGTTWSGYTNGGNSVTCYGVKTDGTLWSWGYSGAGSLGHNQAYPAGSYSSPTQIPGTTWTNNMNAGYTIFGGVKTDGTLWTIGSNTVGALGQNNTTSRSSPVQIPGTTWSKIASSGTGLAAIKTDGTMWSWGQNNHGQMGNNTQSPGYSSPVQIPGTTWVDVSTAHYAYLATKTDGTLWSWGYNSPNYGTLGHNNTVSYSSPVQIGTDTGWDLSKHDAAFAAYQTGALKKA